MVTPTDIMLFGQMIVPSIHSFTKPIDPGLFHVLFAKTR